MEMDINNSILFSNFLFSGVWVQDRIYLLLQKGNLQETSISLETVEDAIPFLEGPSPGLEIEIDINNSILLSVFRSVGPRSDLSPAPRRQPTRDQYQLGDRRRCHPVPRRT